MGNCLNSGNNDKGPDQQLIDYNIPDSFDPRKVYWDVEGNLRHGTTTRNREEELLQILQADSKDETDPTKIWMIVPSRWLKAWLVFVHFKLGDPPGPIDMFSLLKYDSKTLDWRPKRNLIKPASNPDPKADAVQPGHYRRISVEAWIKFIDLYGINGYAIAVRGIPYDNIERWRIFLNPRIIDINKLPPPEIEEEKKLEIETEGKDEKGKTKLKEGRLKMLGKQISLGRWLGKK
jgi:hypothetical protein